MPYPDHEPLSQAKQGRVLIHNPHYDEGIIQKTLELIERSRALLEETRHLVSPQSRSFRPAVSRPLEEPSGVESGPSTQERNAGS